MVEKQLGFKYIMPTAFYVCMRLLFLPIFCPYGTFKKRHRVLISPELAIVLRPFRAIIANAIRLGLYIFSFFVTVHPPLASHWQRIGSLPG